jgi:hypothetical protein
LRSCWPPGLTVHFPGYCGGALAIPSGASAANISVKPACTVGPVRCPALIRTDLRSVPLAEAARDGRTVADVSAVADPGTGVAIYDSGALGGGWTVVGGTSASSPIIASIYALAGNAKTVDYGSFPCAHTSRFFDVTEGSNFTPNQVCGYLCAPGPGYDGPTGLGTPNGTGGF